MIFLLSSLLYISSNCVTQINIEMIKQFKVNFRSNSNFLGFPNVPYNVLSTCERSACRTKFASVEFLQIPYLCISTLIFCSICFTMSGIATDSLTRFFEFWIVFCEYAACITFFGIFLAMMTPSAQVCSYYMSSQLKNMQCEPKNRGDTLANILGICYNICEDLRFIRLPNLIGRLTTSDKRRISRIEVGSYGS